LEDKIIDVTGLPGGAVDATGAGDAFWGAFLSTLLNQDVTRPSQLTRRKILYSNELWQCCRNPLCPKERGDFFTADTHGNRGLYAK